LEFPKAYFMGRHLKTWLLAVAFAAASFRLGQSCNAQTLADALDTTNLVWTTGGNAPWFVQNTNTHDGVDAVRHSNVSAGETSWLETTVTGPATMRYWVKVATVNGRPQAQLSISPGNGSVGEQIVLFLHTYEWFETVLDLEAGTNRLKWSVSNSGNSGNSGFLVLDEVSVGPPRPAQFDYQPMDQTIYAGEITSFSCYASGAPPISYQWCKDGVNIDNATNAYFTRMATTTNDAGLYWVVASNALGIAVSSNAVLTVLPPTAPFFTYEPSDLTAYVGQTVYLYGGVSGSPPFTFHWRKNGTNLPTATSTSVWGSVSLALENLSGAEAGNYTLFVTNDYGNVESDAATVVVDPPVAPVILRHPRSLEVTEGVNTWLAVLAAGAPDPCHIWTKSDVPPGPPPPFLNCQQPRRTFNNATTNDAGVYFASVSNLAGTNISRDALLTVLPPISLAGAWTGGASDIFVTNNLAYLARGSNGLAILSVSNPAAPQLLGTFSPAGYVHRVTVADGMAFLLTSSAQLQIVSVANPINPVLIGSYATPGTASDVAVRANLAFVTAYDAGLLIVNITNPATPALVGSYRTNFSAYAVCVSDNHAIVSAPFLPILVGTNTVQTNVTGTFVLDVSDPMHPFEVGRTGGLEKMLIRDQILFGVSGGSFAAISITNPAQPKLISSFSFHSPPPQ
jgi:hypothetical protein